MFGKICKKCIKLGANDKKTWVAQGRGRGRLFIVFHGISFRKLNFELCESFTSKEGISSSSFDGEG